jgi:hypothetical protein
MSDASSDSLPPGGQRPRGDRARRARRLRLSIAAGTVGVLVVSWNAVAVLGNDGSSRLAAGPGGSIDINAPVTTRQS